jgi:hypothetical protein
LRFVTIQLAQSIIKWTNWDKIKDFLVFAAKFTFLVSHIEFDIFTAHLSLIGNEYLKTTIKYIIIEVGHGCLFSEQIDCLLRNVKMLKLVIEAMVEDAEACDTECDDEDDGEEAASQGRVERPAAVVQLGLVFAKGYRVQ